MAQNPGPSGTSFGTENEDLINANAPFEIPGLFSEFELTLVCANQSEYSTAFVLSMFELSF